MRSKQQTIQLFCALLRINFKNAISRRKAFLWESALMVGNNLIFFLQWIFFFRHFESVRGWHLQEVSIALCVSLGSWGIISLLFGGVREIAYKIIHYELDPLLIHPMGLLPQLLFSRSFPRGAGHLLAGLVLAVCFGNLNWLGLLCLCLALLCGTCILLSATIVAHSLVFFLPMSDKLPIYYCDLVLLFAGYPTHILPIVWQILLFSVIPAGFLAFLPIELIYSFHPLYPILLIATALLSCFFATYFFYFGLRRYLG